MNAIGARGERAGAEIASPAHAIAALLATHSNRARRARGATTAIDIGLEAVLHAVQTRRIDARARRAHAARAVLAGRAFNTNARPVAGSAAALIAGSADRLVIKSANPLEALAHTAWAAQPGAVLVRRALRYAGAACPAGTAPRPSRRRAREPAPGHPHKNRRRRDPGEADRKPLSSNAGGHAQSIRYPVRACPL